ncbi:MAG: zinc ribbon domain-containing protein [Parcubacteria group bacterium]
MEQKSLNFKCSKCNHTACEIGEVRAAGGFWTKIFNIQNKKFTTVTCAQCRYTDLYGVDSSQLGNVFDFFVG